MENSVCLTQPTKEEEAGHTPKSVASQRLSTGTPRGCGIMRQNSHAGRMDLIFSAAHKRGDAIPTGTNANKTCKVVLARVLDVLKPGSEVLIIGAYARNPDISVLTGGLMSGGRVLLS